MRNLIIPTLLLALAITACGDDTDSSNNAANNAANNATTGNNAANSTTLEPTVRAFGEACNPSSDVCEGGLECLDVTPNDLGGSWPMPTRRQICSARCSSANSYDCLDSTGTCVANGGDSEYCAAPDDPLFDTGRPCDPEADDCKGIAQCFQINGTTHQCKLPCEVDLVIESTEHSTTCPTSGATCGSFADGDDAYCR